MKSKKDKKKYLFNKEIGHYNQINLCMMINYDYKKK